jgi:hypothetical protein
MSCILVYHHFDGWIAVIRDRNEEKAHLPHRSPFPHSDVEWMSFINLSCLTRSEEKSFSVISATAMVIRGERENDLLCHAIRVARHDATGVKRDVRRDEVRAYRERQKVDMVLLK